MKNPAGYSQGCVIAMPAGMAIRYTWKKENPIGGEGAEVQASPARSNPAGGAGFYGVNKYPSSVRS
jgi:hypothetical protein